MGVRVQVTSTNNIDRAFEQIESGLIEGINLAAERLLALSAERVPVDLGTLQGSGAVERATDPDEGAAVVYDTPYAARLHEHPEYQFQGGRQGKYLEGPAVEHRKELGDIIREKVRGGGS